MAGVRRVVGVRRVEHAADEATRGAHPALAHLAVAAASPCRGRLGRIARLAGVRRVGRVRRVEHASDEATRAAHPALAHLAVAAAGRVAPGLVDGHAVVADVFGAGVVVVDGDTVQSAEINAQVTGSREEPSCEQAEEARATDDGTVTLHDGSPGQGASIARDMRARPAHTTPLRHGWPRSIAFSR